MTTLFTQYFLGEITLEQLNSAVAKDVNQSGTISALDALVVINLLATEPFTNPATSVSVPLISPTATTDGKYDVNGDGQYTTLDMLVASNELGSRASGDTGLKLVDACQPFYYDVSGNSYSRRWICCS